MTFHAEYYPDVVPPSDPKMRGADYLVFINIRKSCLYSVAARTRIIPCSEALGWIISHADVENKTILNEQGRCVGSYLPPELEKYYKLLQLEVYMIKALLQLEVYMIKGFVDQFNKEYDTKKILSSWCVEDKRFFGKSDGIYSITNLSSNSQAIW